MIKFDSSYVKKGTCKSVSKGRRNNEIYARN